MATATTDLLITKFGYIREDYPSTHYTIGTDWYELNNVPDKILLFALAAFPSSLKHNKLTGLKYYFQLKEPGGDAFFVSSNDSDFDASTVTFYTAPTKNSSVLQNRSFDYGYSSGNYAIPASLDGSLSQARRAGIALRAASLRLEANFGNVKTKLSDSSTPYARVTYDDAAKVASKIQRTAGPVSGYSNPRNATVFSWDYVKANEDEYCADETWNQASGTFYWKESTAGSYTPVSAGTAKSVTIAANIFPANKTIQWYVAGTDDEGTATQTEVFSFSTAAGTASAVAQSPISSVEDGSAPIVFRWALTSTDGQTPSAVDLQWKTPEDDNWTDLLSQAAAATEYTAAANTFPAGEIQWRVRAYNVDSVAGPWSAPDSGWYSFICVNAPDPPDGLEATSVPRTTISWQASGQEAYEIQIDGETVRQAFGADVYSWQVEEPMSEGEHTIGVRVQGVYGLWSQWSEITIRVGGPTGSISLTGNFGTDAWLTPTGSLSTDTVRYYRDGELIGTAPGDVSFIDRRALGIHSYFARIFLAGGEYSQTNTVTGTMATNVKLIAPLDDLTSGWLELRLSEQSNGQEEFRWSRNQSLQHVAGAVWPQLERAPYEDLTGTYDVAFKDLQSAQAFEALRGRVVILKSRDENVVIGMLAALAKRTTLFYTSYTFTLQQIHMRDFTEIAP